VTLPPRLAGGSRASLARGSITDIGRGCCVIEVYSCDTPFCERVEGVYHVYSLKKGNVPEKVVAGDPLFREISLIPAGLLCIPDLGNLG